TKKTSIFMNSGENILRPPARFDSGRNLKLCHIPPLATGKDVIGTPLAFETFERESAAQEALTG
ncbi:MAG: hypothetical protein MI673_05105, partial [Thiotrichales bacterium]|nr:hypothetical protein [Thiotrichales bacterium]